MLAERHDNISRADLESALQRHCELLSGFIDSRMAEYHQDVLKYIAVQESERRGLQIRRMSIASKDGSLTARSQESAAQEQDEVDDVVPRAEAAAGGKAPCGKMKRARSFNRESVIGALRSERLEPRSGISSVCQSEANSISPTASVGVSIQDFGTYQQSEHIKKLKSKAVQSADSKLAARGTSRLVTWRESLQRGIDSNRFETLVCLLIFSNVCFLGFEVQSLVGVSDEDIPFHYKVVEYGYTIFFLVEWLMRILASGIYRFFCGRRVFWHLIDTVLVVTSVTEGCLEVIHSGSEHKFAYMRIIRIARMMRIFRVVRIMKFFRPLRILVQSIYNTLKSIFWVVVLLLLITYLFGVIFAMASSQALVSGTLRNPEMVNIYFGTLWASIYSLFKSISGGMDWQFPASAANELNPGWAALFVAYIAFSHFAVLNVVTGVVCQTAIESAQQDQDIVMQSQMALKQKYVEQLENLFRNLDSDRSGKITLSEFERHMHDANLQAYFDAMELTADEAWSLFKLIDVNDTAAIDIEDFVSGCLKLRGNARSIDVHMLMYESKWTMAKLADIMAFIAASQEPSQLPTRRLSLTASACSQVSAVDHQVPGDARTTEPLTMQL